MCIHIDRKKTNKLTNCFIWLMLLSPVKCFHTLTRNLRCQLRFSFNPMPIMLVIFFLLLFNVFSTFEKAFTFHTHTHVLNAIKKLSPFEWFTKNLIQFIYEFNTINIYSRHVPVFDILYSFKKQQQRSRTMRFYRAKWTLATYQHTISFIRLKRAVWCDFYEHLYFAYILILHFGQWQWFNSMVALNKLSIVMNRRICEYKVSFKNNRSKS